ncbi:Carboxy-terminal domain (CTD) phosphatase [Ceratobasidium sp. 414]|nr:Carboxy-terminal domain (CTD) phosphatase [Ceratobasidium sp. 414]
MSDTLSIAAVGVQCPVLIERAHQAAGDDMVSKGTRLFSWTRPPRKPGIVWPHPERGEVIMPYGGTLVSWDVVAGAVITEGSTPIARLEPCRHPVEWGGMCASCGDDVGSYGVRLTHDAAGPTVSHEEAHRIERETAERLVGARKLSLIVDLDQTVVHATVDPTVRDWMAQGEPNPNWPALRDVKSFVLDDGSSPGGCWYYIKPRPGLADFLKNLSTKYEMHVYTMGTRAYAMEVCAAIDPDGSIFAGRILSRDESGSMTHKNIERLFPVDQSMVVIIDDRADVWDTHQNNLVKVVPYDFFVGIGDINAGLLPKQQDTLQLPPGASPNATLPTTTPAPTPSQPTPDPEDVTPEKTTTPPGSPPDSTEAEPSNSAVVEPTPTEPPTPAAPTDTASTHSTSTDADPSPAPVPFTTTISLSIDLPPTDSDIPTPSLLSPPTPTLEESATLSSARAKLEARGEGEREEAVRESIIQAVREERPLARKQEALAGEGGGREAKDGEEKRAGEGGVTGEARAGEGSGEAVLKDDDRELDRIYYVLDEIHTRFFQAYEQEWVAGNRGGRVLSANRGFNVQRIIPAIKRRVLAGVHILFSSVIPINADPTSSEYWRQSELFGAKCYTKLGPQITHVVAAKRGTEKVNQARTHGGIAIVRPEWLHRVVTTWSRPPEEDFFLELGDREEYVKRKEAASANENEAGVVENGASSGEVAVEETMNGAGGEEDVEVEVDDEAREKVDDILHGFDYQAELDALMDSDTETDDGSASGISAAHVSSTRTSRRGTPAPQPPSQPLKRQRSVTPSIATSVSNLDADPLTRSPLAKRKRLSEMRGSSGLGNQLNLTPDQSETNGADVVATPENGEDSEESEESSSDESEIADFLAEDLFNGEEEGEGAD